MRAVAAILVFGLIAGLAGGAAPAAGASCWTAARNLPGTAGAGFPFDVDVGPRGTAAVAFVETACRSSGATPAVAGTRPSGCRRRPRA